MCTQLSGSVVAVRVGIRELRARLASHLETATPIEVTRHGRTVGLYVPLPQESDLSDHERLLEAGRLMQAELQRLVKTCGADGYVRKDQLIAKEILDLLT